MKTKQIPNDNKDNTPTTAKSELKKTRNLCVVRKAEMATLWKAETDKERIDKSRPFIRFGMSLLMLFETHVFLATHNTLVYWWLGVYGARWNRQRHRYTQYGCCFCYCITTFYVQLSQFHRIFSRFSQMIFFFLFVLCIVQCSLQTLPTAKSQQQIYIKNNIEIFTRRNKKKKKMRRRRERAYIVCGRKENRNNCNGCDLHAVWIFWGRNRGRRK